MAGHLPIQTTKFHEGLKWFFLNSWNIKMIDFFKRFPHNDTGGYFQRLSYDYNMDDDHGKLDDEIFSYTPSHGEFILEFHIDNNQNINQIYHVE